MKTMTVCAIAQEPLLLVGPPGTAKSALVTTFRDHLGVSDEDYFEYMLTRFTEPSEVMGPIDVRAFRDGAFARRVQGKLPTAKMAFLDEIFKSNSAILNSLLTIINERKFYQDGTPISVPLRILFAATNEIPDLEDLSAIRDRFALKVLTSSVQESHFVDLIDKGLEMSSRKEANVKSGEPLATFQDFLDAHDYLMGQMTGPSDREKFFPAKVMKQFQAVLRQMRTDHGISISDRSVLKLYKLLRTQAWLDHGGVVTSEDLLLLSHAGDTLEDLENLRTLIPRLLGAS